MPEAIVSAAIAGDLALFCGAGISTENKNVLPYSLYESIKEEIDVKDDTLSFSQLMDQYCKKPDGRKKLLNRIRERFQYIHSFPELERQATAFHRELADIYQIRTIITTNWDTYFEEYCGAIPITIPEDYSYWDDNSRYVLKIHGTINNLSTIVATTKDYKKCYNNLQKGIVGATLKQILATKTVVFMGFSFGDQDLLQIIKYLRKEMKDIYPQIYLVTLDESLNQRLRYKRSTEIITAGAFFLHKLKHELKERGMIINDEAEDMVSLALSINREIHTKTSKMDLSRNPTIIYTLAYQDGITHAFERYLQNKKTGEYNQPGQNATTIRFYKEMIGVKHSEGNFWDEAYYEGYLNGLVLIETSESEIDIIKEFPFFYLPNVKKGITNPKDYEELLKKTSTKSKYYRYAKRIVNERTSPGLVVHHPPY